MRAKLNPSRAMKLQPSKDKHKGDISMKRLFSMIMLTESFAYDKRDRYVPVIKEIQFEGNLLSCSSPPHSKIKVKK
jgi:hypothetical protein